MKTKDKMWKGEGGFTLVELLIVVAILAILVAVVLASFTGLLSGSKATANSAELNIVQTAVDVRMANESLATYPDTATDTNVMGAAQFNLYPQYMRSSTSTCNYTVVADGTVSQVSCP
jgi:type IV pilus assembly protein PilA